MHYSNKIIEEVKSYKQVVEQAWDLYLQKFELLQKINQYECMDTIQELENKIELASMKAKNSINKYGYQN